MKPDNSVICRVVPEVTSGALVERQKAYAVYLHVPLPRKPKDLRKHLRDDINATVWLDLPAGDFKAEWVNTKTGRTDRSESFHHTGGERKLDSPRFSNDIALRVVLHK